MRSSEDPANPSWRLRSAGIVLPEPPTPIAQFVNHKQVGNLLFISGQGPREANGVCHAGKVGVDVSLEAARAHARLAGINVISVAQDALGDLSRVESVVKLLGMVNASPDFADHPKVIDGCSELFVEIFGGAGTHARSAVGVSSLPNNFTVEIEAILAVRT
jgi:enamine deaminase RidA (YjgF/YER057c/UK114 family)